jgi:signal transduction histidine kinase
MASWTDAFKFLRLFLIVSLTSIVVTIALLTLLYRHETIRSTISLSEASSQAWAQAALISLRPELDDFLASAADTGVRESSAQRLAARITEVVSELTRNNAGLVVRVNLFDRGGVVIFSTDRGRIGEDQGSNAGFMSALNGRVTNNLIYRDIFNRYPSRGDAGHLGPNLIETYIPVRAGATKSVDAVFESYTDVSPLVARNQNTALAVLTGVGLVLLMLYGVLILAMQRTLKAIESQQGRVAGTELEAVKAQQQSISNRTAALEMLSAKLLSSGELERKKIAFGLHEGLAQTLLTTKLNIERRLAQNADGRADGRADGGLLALTVSLLQAAIDDVERIATGMRPSMLDDRGLVPTIKWFCSEFERLNPAIAVAEEISVQEDDLPEPLKIVIYRVIEAAFASIARHENADRIRLGLQLAGGAMTLTIEDTSRDSRYAASAQRDAALDLQLRFGEAQERTTLSGGSFTIARQKAGGIALRASWPV